MTKWLRCRDCHQPLTNPDSQRLGYGGACAEKRGLIPPRRRRTTRAVRRAAPVPPASDALPGQDQIPLFYFEATLWSL